MSHANINQQLAEVIGVETIDCVGFTLEVKAGTFPLLTVRRLVLDAPGIGESTRLFYLLDVEQADQPFDLDRMVGEAKQRLEAQLFLAYRTALQALKGDSFGEKTVVLTNRRRSPR